MGLNFEKGRVIIVTTQVPGTSRCAKRAEYKLKFL